MRRTVAPRRVVQQKAGPGGAGVGWRQTCRSTCPQRDRRALSMALAWLVTVLWRPVAITVLVIALTHAYFAARQGARKLARRAPQAPRGCQPDPRRPLAGANSHRDGWLRVILVPRSCSYKQTPPPLFGFVRLRAGERQGPEQCARRGEDIQLRKVWGEGEAPIGATVAHRMCISPSSTPHEPVPCDSLRPGRSSQRASGNWIARGAAG